MGGCKCAGRTPAKSEAAREHLSWSEGRLRSDGGANICDAASVVLMVWWRLSIWFCFRGSAAAAWYLNLGGLRQDPRRRATVWGDLRL